MRRHPKECLQRGWGIQAGLGKWKGPEQNKVAGGALQGRGGKGVGPHLLMLRAVGVWEVLIHGCPLWCMRMNGVSGSEKTRKVRAGWSQTGFGRHTQGFRL